MSEAEIMKRIEEIKACAGDDERAHSMEDDLHRDVLACIAASPGDERVSELARLALLTCDIDFSRWCA